VFYLAFLPQFVGPSDPVLPTFLALAAIHAALGLVWLSLLASLLERARDWFGRPGVRRALDGVSGAVLVALGARLALARR
jgi:threonine/homoserine/homoserine lactone efflux protein